MDYLPYDYIYLALVSAQLSSLYSIIYRQFALSRQHLHQLHILPTILQDAKANRALLPDPFDDLD